MVPGTDKKICAYLLSHSASCSSGTTVVDDLTLTFITHPYDVVFSTLVVMCFSRVIGG